MTEFSFQGWTILLTTAGFCSRSEMYFVCMNFVSFVIVFVYFCSQQSSAFQIHPIVFLHFSIPLYNLCLKDIHTVSRRSCRPVFLILSFYLYFFPLPLSLPRSVFIHFVLKLQLLLSDSIQWAFSMKPTAALKPHTAKQSTLLLFLYALLSIKASLWNTAQQQQKRCQNQSVIYGCVWHIMWYLNSFFFKEYLFSILFIKHYYSF